MIGLLPHLSHIKLLWMVKLVDSSYSIYDFEHFFGLGYLYGLVVERILKLLWVSLLSL